MRVEKVFENGDRVRIRALPEHTEDQRKALVGKTGIVVSDDGSYLEVLIDDDEMILGTFKHLFTDAELEYVDEKPQEFWMIDYLHAVFPQWGLFESEEAAWKWIDTHNSHLPRHSFTPFLVTVNDKNEGTVKTTCPEHRYVNQR